MIVFGGGNSITLFRVAGIRIAVDWSWFLFLFIVIVWLSGFYGDILDDHGSTQAYLLALASAVGPLSPAWSCALRAGSV